MNTEYRNKLYNRIKDVFEKEDTQERQAFMEARENFNLQQKSAFELAKEVVERSYPKEDVAILRQFKKKYGQPCDVVAKISVFILHITKMLMMRAKNKKQNHILILVFGVISMVKSMATIERVNILHMPILEKN